MLLSVIIVSYNTEKLTLETIKSVVSSTEKSKVLNKNIEIIVVDNNSQDDTVASLKKLKKEIAVPLLIIENKKNVGFGNANNQAIEKASGTHYLFLNSDTIVREHALENMIKRFLEEEKNVNENTDASDIEKLGVLSPVLLNTDLTYQPQGGSFPTLLSLFFHMSMLDDLPIIGKYFPSTQHTGKSNRLTLDVIKHYTDVIPVDWVGGTAMMISKTVIEAIGSFDQNIFMYGEDTEICMRAKNHHYVVAIDPTAEIIHLQNMSSTSQNAIQGEFKGYLYIFSKHNSAVQASIAKMLLQLGAIVRIFVFSVLLKNSEKVSVYKSVLQDLS